MESDRPKGERTRTGRTLHLGREPETHTPPRLYYISNEVPPSSLIMIFGEEYSPSASNPISAFFSLSFVVPLCLNSGDDDDL